MVEAEVEGEVVLGAWGACLGAGSDGNETGTGAVDTVAYEVEGFRALLVIPYRCQRFSSSWRCLARASTSSEGAGLYTRACRSSSDTLSSSSVFSWDRGVFEDIARR